MLANEHSPSISPASNQRHHLGSEVFLLIERRVSVGMRRLILINLAPLQPRQTPWLNALQREARDKFAEKGLKTYIIGRLSGEHRGRESSRVGTEWATELPLQLEDLKRFVTGCLRAWRRGTRWGFTWTWGVTLICYQVQFQPLSSQGVTEPLFVCFYILIQVSISCLVTLRVITKENQFIHFALVTSHLLASLPSPESPHLTTCTSSPRQSVAGLPAVCCRWHAPLSSWQSLLLFFISSNLFESQTVPHKEMSRSAHMLLTRHGL